MAYIKRDQVLNVISKDDLNAFLDDDRDGTEDTGRFDSTVSMCSLAVDGQLAAIYTVPFSSPVPAMVQAATLAFFGEMVYQKRLTPTEKNPFKTQADMWRKSLNSIRENGTGLDQALDRAFTPGFVSTACLAFNRTSM